MSELIIIVIVIVAVIGTLAGFVVGASYATGFWPWQS